MNRRPPSMDRHPATIGRPRGDEGFIALLILLLLILALVGLTVAAWIRGDL